MTDPTTKSIIQLLGAFAFGVIIGWRVYFTDRYRTGAVDFNDIATVIGIVGGGAILSLFQAGTDLFGAYGIGLALGFFAYHIRLAAWSHDQRTSTRIFLSTAGAQRCPTNSSSPTMCAALPVRWAMGPCRPILMAAAAGRTE